MVTDLLVTARLLCILKQFLTSYYKLVIMLSSFVDSFGCESVKTCKVCISVTRFHTHVKVEIPVNVIYERSK